MRAIVFIFFYFLLHSIGFGQSYLEFSGIVVDKTNGIPLPYCTIGVAGNTIGTITNSDGKFHLKIALAYKNDSITISSLGYISKRLVIPNQSKNYMKIELERNVFFISEIFVEPISPTKILTEAVLRIPNNYHQSSMQYNAFFQEVISENRNCIQVVEAILEIYKGAYGNKKDRDMVKILKGRKRDEVTPTWLWDYLIFIDGTHEMLHCDVAKYPKHFITVSQNHISFLNKRYFKHYTYWIWQATAQDGTGIYVIGFRPKRRRASYEGKIIIDKKTLAFRRMEYQFSYKNINRATLLNSLTKSELAKCDITTKALDFYSDVNYKRNGNKWVLDYTRNNYSFLIISEPNNKISVISNNTLMAVTFISQDKVKPLKRRHVVKRQQSLIKQIGDADEAFWENYNYIKLPDQPNCW